MCFSSFNFSVNYSDLVNAVNSLKSFLISFKLTLDFFPMLNCVIVMQNKCRVAVLGLIMRNALSLVGNGSFIRLDWKLILTIIRFFASVVSVI